MSAELNLRSLATVVLSKCVCDRLSQPSRGIINSYTYLLTYLLTSPVVLQAMLGLQVDLRALKLSAFSFFPFPLSIPPRFPAVSQEAQVRTF